MIKDGKDIAWCPGCGNFIILQNIKEALNRLGRPLNQFLFVSGIGQAAKLPHYLDGVNVFNGLHGRALPVAVAAKIANSDLTVIADSGDGCMYGEGGNHFLHNIRRNVDITAIIHNNQVYGLTKGQASPTSELGMKTVAQTFGVIETPFSPVAMSVAQDASFVARTFAGDSDHMVETLISAVNHRGFAVVDVLQNCVTFNKINTFQWYKERVQKLPEDYDPTDRAKAFETSLVWGDKIPIGVIYKHERPTYHDLNPALKDGPPLWQRWNEDMSIYQKMLEEFS